MAVSRCQLESAGNLVVVVQMGGGSGSTGAEAAYGVWVLQVIWPHQALEDTDQTTRCFITSGRGSALLSLLE